MMCFMIGTPIPVARSKPLTAGKNPLLFSTWPAPLMSWKKTCGARLYIRYSSGLRFPLRWPWKLSRSAAMADHNGDDRLVPPMPNHPGGVWNWLNCPQTLNGVLALPVQNSAYGVFSSALAEMSGSSRHGVPPVASAHWVEPLPAVLNELLTPGPNW